MIRGTIVDLRIFSFGPNSQDATCCLLVTSLILRGRAPRRRACLPPFLLLSPVSWKGKGFYPSGSFDYPIIKGNYKTERLRGGIAGRPVALRVSWETTVRLLNSIYGMSDVIISRS